MNLISGSSASSTDLTTGTADGPTNTAGASPEPEPSDKTEASPEPEPTGSIDPSPEPESTDTTDSTRDPSGKCFWHFTKEEYRHFLWGILFSRKNVNFFCYFPFTDDKFSVTSELTFSAGINSTNFEKEKRSLEESIHGILIEDAQFVKISDVELTFKKEFPTTSRIQRSTGSILVMTIGPFNEDNARGIREIVNLKFFDQFEQENVNTPLVLESISNASK